MRAHNSWSSGQGTITFTITSGCGNPVQVQKTFWVGGPSAQGIDIYNVYDPMTLCPHTQYIVEAYYGFYGGGPIIEYEWMLPSGWTSIQGGSQNPFTHNDAIVQVNPASMYNPGFIRVMAKNEACGYGPPFFLWVDTQCDPWLMSIYPNPANDELHITLGDPLRNERALLLIYDDQQVKRLEQDISGNETISVAHLRDGVYYIELTSKRGVQRKRLILKK